MCSSVDEVARTRAFPSFPETSVTQWIIEKTHFSLLCVLNGQVREFSQGLGQQAWLRHCAGSANMPFSFFLSFHNRRCKFSPDVTLLDDTTAILLWKRYPGFRFNYLMPLLISPGTSERSGNRGKSSQTRIRIIGETRIVVIPTSYPNSPATMNVLVYPHGNNPNTNHDLPTELLFTIFNLVYEDLYGDHQPWVPRGLIWEVHEEAHLERKRLQSRPDRDQWMTSCSMFPYAIASISPRWRAIAKSVPKFWQRLIILVDDPPTPPGAVDSFLRWSDDEPLDVTITRRWGVEDPTNGRHERSRTIAIMNFLSRHMWHIHDLRFDVMFSSSLPSFPCDFYGLAPILEHLELLCKKDDDDPDDDVSIAVSSTDSEYDEFECPSLVCLFLDGRNYHEATLADPNWTDLYPQMRSLTICHFTQRTFFSPYDLLQPLIDTEAHTLHIIDVDLDPSPEVHQINLRNLSCLVFEDMHDSQIMDHIINLVNPAELTCIRCTFVGAFRHFGRQNQGVLVLEDIDGDISPLVRAFDGETLNITRCPGFDDTVLDMMTGPEEDQTLACTRYLQNLDILDCPNFSIAALRRLVASRLHLENFPGAAAVELPVQVIFLDGDVPAISDVDWEWFQENVEIHRPGETPSDTDAEGSQSD